MDVLGYEESGVSGAMGGVLAREDEIILAVQARPRRSRGRRGRERRDLDRSHQDQTVQGWQRFGWKVGALGREVARSERDFGEMALRRYLATSMTATVA